jgi:hypothetical protein
MALDLTARVISRCGLATALDETLDAESDLGLPDQPHPPALGPGLADPGPVGDLGADTNPAGAREPTLGLAPGTDSKRDVGGSLGLVEDGEALDSGAPLQHYPSGAGGGDEESSGAPPRVAAHVAEAELTWGRHRGSGGERLPVRAAPAAASPGQVDLIGAVGIHCPDVASS